MCGPLGGVLTGGKIGPKTAMLGVVGSRLLKGKGKQPASRQTFGDGTTDPRTGGMS